MNKALRSSPANFLLFLAAIGGVYALGPATVSAAESASIQPLLNPDGTGGMIVNSQTNPEGEAWSWESCAPPGGTCGPFGSGRIIETFDVAATTIFKATSSRGATTLSPLWHGNVAPAAPPSVAGEVRANELVTPIPGRWNGGWQGDVDWTQLAACSTLGDRACTTLTHRHYVDGCPNGAAVIDPTFTGNYLRVADSRVPAGTPELAFAVGSPYGPDIWPPTKTTSVAFVGRIAPALDDEAADCGPSTLVEASISRKGVTTVRCGLGCNATLVARQGKRRAHISRKLEPMPYIPTRVSDIPKLRLPARPLAHFEPGTARITVVVNGRKAAGRTIRLP